MRWTTDKIRQSFLDFFAERGHRIVPSAPLIPKGDPTLLFTNAGMVPFKDFFLGVRTAPDPRVVDCQKCLRISGKHNDLEAVGRDSYHHTFFEMLGNWSFGDYYKREAIRWHWELVTKVWEIPAERLWATVYQGDDEAYSEWEKIPDLRPGRILRCGEKDNFWEMGETGPCGPCSEIHIDREPDGTRPTDTPGEACDQNAHCGVSCAVNVEGCSRFIELGNLVFIQYNRDAVGKLTPLPKQHVDTGTGLERVAAVLQSLETGTLLGNYDVDIFKTIIRSIEKAAGNFGSSAHYGKDSERDISFRAIADHARAISFLIADGIAPGNNDREYVLRRLIRRAARHGRRVGIDRPFLAAICNGVREAMGDAYPQLTAEAGRIETLVRDEETRFGETLDRGLTLLRSEAKLVSRKNLLILSKDVAFKLYDTYGFPLDLTQDVLREDGFEVDVAGFERLMEEQRERGRAARKDETIAPEIALDASVKSRFVGERRYAAESEIVAVTDGDEGRITIVAAETPFYPEGGGQVGDRGVIETASGALAEIIDSRKQDGSILHIGKILRGAPGDFARGARVTLKIDRARRDASMINHSATHILHYALRDLLGGEVHQAGSLVAPERLRFDFSHNGPVGAARLAAIEEEINARIRENAPVTTEEMAYDDALKAGALAFFGDKYGDRVRVVRMGDFSTELCGGTHVARTGDAGLFKLEAESGVAAGVRRIEAVTGQGALDAIRRREKILDELGSQLGARDGAALERLERLIAREKELEKKLRALEQKLIAGASGGAADAEKIGEAKGIKIVTRKVEGVEAKSLREMADRMREKHPSAVIGIGSALDGGKAAILIAVTADLTGRVKAGDLIKQIAPLIGGTGGGKPELAQAGGANAAGLDAALAKIASLV